MTLRTGPLATIFLGLLLTACGAVQSGASWTAVSELRRYTGPDPAKTPGALCDQNNPDFDGLRYPERIVHCRRNVDTSTKVAVAEAYGVIGEARREFQIDHFIPLNIGGSNAVTNLWPLAVPLAEEKSRYEYWLMQRVAGGEMLQAEAIQRIKAWRPGLAY